MSEPETAEVELPKTSVARRMRAFFSACLSFKGNHRLVEAWSQKLQIVIDPNSPNTAAAVVATHLASVLTQLDTLDARLKTETQLSPSTTSFQVDRLRTFIGACLSNLQTPWDSVKGNLSPDLVKCLEFWDELLVPDEVQLSDQSVNELLKAMRELRGKIVSLDSNPILKRVLLEVLDVLLQGLADYAISGEAAIRTASREAFARIIQNRDIIRDNAQDPAVSAFGRIWKKFQEVCAPIVLADRLIHAIDTTKALGSEVIKLLGRTIGS